MACYDTYRDQLTGLYRGHALWVPDPAGLYDRVRVGDVGFVKQGHFFRMFNALLPANDSQQVYGVPEGFVPLDTGPFPNTRTLNLFQGDYCSLTVTVDHEDGRQAGFPEEATSTLFRCRGRNQGAFLSLPFNGVSEDAFRTKAFETYIRKHCDSWLDFAMTNELDVRLEYIILVTGCDLTSSWAMAAFVNTLDPEISLKVQASEAGRAEFQWTVTNQPHHNEPNQNVVKSHCVFIRGFRAKRIFPFFKTLKAAAGPRPDNPDNEPESSIELLREPAVPDYRDPLIGILDYIAGQRPDQEIAIVHEDDLKMIKGVDVLTADAVEKFLSQNKILVRTEKGVAHLTNEDDEGIPEEKRMTFYARADVGGDSEQQPLIIHPVLMNYPHEFDIASQSLENDFGLPTEELLSSAVHPPVLTLVLENEQGPPQNIEVRASEKGIGVTVGDVLKTIRVYLRESSGQREWAANEDIRREVQDAFEDSATTEERSGGLRRIDYLRGRNRLQILPKHPPPEEDDGIRNYNKNNVDAVVEAALARAMERWSKRDPPSIPAASLQSRNPAPGNSSTTAPKTSTSKRSRNAPQRVTTPFHKKK